MWRWGRRQTHTRHTAAVVCAHAAAMASPTTSVCAQPSTARYPGMQEMSEAVVSILDILNLTEVVILGVGAGANIAARVSLSHSSRVLGVILVQPVLGGVGLLEQVRLRSVVSDLRLGPSKETDNFFLQHAFGKFSEREERASTLITDLTIYRDNLHSDQPQVTNTNPGLLNFTDLSGTSHCSLILS